jgi:predicted AAA+ superfamily ATPase
MVGKIALEAVLNDWNYWQEPPPLAIPRDCLKKPIPLAPDLVLLVQGVRRCGKSTLLTQIMQQHHLDPLDCTFVNFEDPRLSDHLDHTLLDTIVTFSEKRRPGKKLYFFFDEIQNVAQWQKWIHGKLERPKKNCFAITGSNASLLSGDLATSLTGRHTTIELFPFDFFEYRLARPESSLTNYFDDGGFPRTLSYPDPQGLLRDYFTDIIERDVRRHVAVRSTLTLTQLVKAVFESTGSEVSQRTLAKILGVTADTVKTYLDACESAYILLPCPYFTFSERQRSARNIKYYPIDLGMRRAIITQTGADIGKSLETVVFHYLRKKYGRVFYWRQTGEIDFVVQDGRNILPFHVTWDGMKDRHQKSAAEFRETFPKAEDVMCITSKNVIDWLAE